MIYSATPIVKAGGVSYIVCRCDHEARGTPLPPGRFSFMRWEAQQHNDRFRSDLFINSKATHVGAYDTIKAVLKDLAALGEKGCSMRRARVDEIAHLPVLGGVATSIKLDTPICPDCGEEISATATPCGEVRRREEAMERVQIINICDMPIPGPPGVHESLVSD